jgi:hypothetical protein
LGIRAGRIIFHGAWEKGEGLCGGSVGNGDGAKNPDPIPEQMFYILYI